MGHSGRGVESARLIELQRNHEWLEAVCWLEGAADDVGETRGLGFSVTPWTAALPFLEYEQGGGQCAEDGH